MADTDGFRIALSGGAGNAGAWIYVRLMEDGFGVYARVEVRDGRVTIVDLRLHTGTTGPSGEHPVTAEMLRAVPLGRIEAVLNHPDVLPDIERLAKELDPARTDEERQFWDERVAWATDEALDGLRELLTSSLKLNIPEGRGRKPDEFYRRAAAAYASAAHQGHSSPARAVAEANDVPTTTVHRWIKEARSRELMPPSRRATEEDER